MTALDFPDAPTVGQLYGATGGTVWRWDGARWASTTGTAGVRGRVAYAQVVTTQAAIGTTATLISGLSVTFIADPSRTYRTTVVAALYSTLAAQMGTVYIDNGSGAQLQQQNVQLSSPAGYASWFHPSIVETGLSGSVTRRATALVIGTGGTATSYAQPNIPCYILVEDITYEGGQSSALIPYALGIVAKGATVDVAGLNVASAVVTLITNTINFTSQVGRRYRMRCMSRAINPQAAACSARFLPTGTNSLSANPSNEIWVTVPNMYSSLLAEWIFDGTGVASTYSVSVNPYGAGITMYLEASVCPFYIEDVGPVR